MGYQESTAPRIQAIKRKILKSIRRNKRIQWSKVLSNQDTEICRSYWWIQKSKNSRIQAIERVYTLTLFRNLAILGPRNRLIFVNHDVDPKLRGSKDLREYSLTYFLRVIESSDLRIYFIISYWEQYLECNEMITQGCDRLEY